MNIRITPFLAGIMLFGSCAVGFAQSYDDDDIYFNPSKVKSESKKQKNTFEPQAYQSATSVPQSGVNIDVDTYNRRGVFASADTIGESAQTGDFNYTRQIERFHNPDIIASSNDADLANLYYSQPSTDVNIYVNTVPSVGYWGYPYPLSSWYWGYARPYSWYWNCGWDPYWAWGPSWSWSPSWCWGPSWNWGWGHGWGSAIIPSRPNRPVGNIRPAYRPASRPSAGNIRPGQTMRPAYRPSSRPSADTYRPGNSSSGYRQSGNSVRKGSGSIRQGNSNLRQNNSSNNSYRQNSNTNSYRYQNNSNNSSYRSSGSFGGYRGGSAGSMGGGSRGGGGRGRH
ncbi:MAG: hypothetical protein K2L46_06435 [Paramuribaculum sp.]|nr:hypothetical protein [Paramuribaculum sp.]MDE6488901.1 hypothetical protein [Paramuribaculum sp.]